MRSPVIKTVIKVGVIKTHQRAEC